MPRAIGVASQMGSGNPPQGSVGSSAAPKSREDVVALLADVESQLKTLKEAHEARRRESARLKELADSISEKEREFESRAATLKDRQHELDEARQKVAQLERDASNREREHSAAQTRAADLEHDLKDARSKFQRLTEEHAGAREDLRTAHDLAAQRQQDREAREESWRAEGQSLRDQIDVLHKERENLKRESKSARNDRDGARDDAQSRIQKLEHRIQTLESDIHSREEALGARQGELKQAQASQADLQNTLSQLQSRLEQAEAAAGEQADQLRVELDGTREALVTANREGSDQIEALKVEIQEARQRLDGAASEAQELIEKERQSLRAEIDTAKAKLDDAMIELQTRTEELRTVAGEYKVARDGLGEAQSATESMERELGESREQITRQQSQCGMLEEALAQSVARERVAEAKANDFEQRLDAAQGEGGIDEEVAERIKELVEQRDRTQADLENFAKENQRLRLESEQGPPEVEDLRSELEQTRRELEQAREDSNASPEPEIVTIARSDDFTETRRDRLRIAKRMLKDRARKFKTASGALIRRMEEAEALIKQRGEVVQATHRLRAMDKRLHQRQAGAKAGIGLICMVLSLAIVGSFAWISAGSIAPARFAAVVGIEPHVSGRTLTDEQMRVWKEATQQILLDPGVISSAANRMGDRGIEDLSDPISLALRLEKDLAVLDTSADQITLELRGDGKRETERVLDTYSRAVVSAANRSGGTQISSAAAQLAGPVEVGEPIESQHLYYAAVGVALGALFCVLLMLVLYRKLAKVKSDFEQAAGLDLVLDDTRWIAPSQAS